MPLSFTFSYGKNDGLVISPDNLKKLYFYGIPLVERNGTEISDSTISSFIQSAQDQIENLLSIKIWKQLLEEKLNFTRSDFDQFGYVKTSYPVASPYVMEGWIGLTQQIVFPEGWLSSRTTSDGQSYHRQIWIVPSGAAASPQPIIFGTTHPYLGYYGLKHIPDYWKVKYITGYEKPPMDIVTLVGKIAAIFIFQQLGDIILGPGLSSTNLSIDGLSQSVQTIQGGYKNRIEGYLKDLEREGPMLVGKYKGMRLTVL